MKYGLKYIFRTPLKTILFFLLIAVITIFLSIGLGMLSAAENMLDEADQTFMTAGEFVYTSGAYPDDTIYDESFAQFNEGFNLEDYHLNEVLMMEENLLQRAFVEEYTPKNSDMAYSQIAVLTIKTTYYDEDYSAWYASVYEQHYSEADTKAVLVLDSDNFVIEKGNSLYEPGLSD